MTVATDLARETSSTFANGLRVLLAFDRNDSEMTIPQIARKTGLNRTAVRRLVLTLLAMGFLAERERRYALTPKVLSFGLGYLQAQRVGAAIQPVLLEAARKIGLPISYAVRDGEEAVYVAHAAAALSLITEGFTIGSRLPLLATAIGRAILAFMPLDERQRLVAEAPLAPLTPKTAGRETVDRRVEQAREIGFAYVCEEFELGVASLAVPVRRSSGELLGAIGTAAAAADLPPPGADDPLVSEMKSLAARLAAVL